MPVHPARTVGQPIEVGPYTWDADRVILYHLGMGAGVPAGDPLELRLTYEHGLQVLPTFGVLPAMGAIDAARTAPGIEFTGPFLHAAHELEVLAPIPTAGSVTTAGHYSAVYDRGNGAMLVMDVTTRMSDGRALFRNRFSMFLRGEGGFGGEPGPPPGNHPPDRPPDDIAVIHTLPQQALLFRLCSHKSALHVDPDYARRAGFEGPLLQGMASYGAVCKAAVNRMLGGDAAAVARYQARLAGIVYPGETIRAAFWRDGGAVIITADTVERGTPVLRNAAIFVRKAGLT
jgi:acyl dehydratase